jgi:hypothetical protein
MRNTSGLNVLAVLALTTIAALLALACGDAGTTRQSTRSVSADIPPWS